MVPGSFLKSLGFTWWQRLGCRLGLWPRFRPGVFYHTELRFTEIVLRDTPVVWCPWGDPAWGHAVDCGYDFDGELVAIRIWDDVRERRDTEEAQP